MLSPRHPLSIRPSIPLACLSDENYIDIHAGKESDNSLCFERNHIHTANQFASVNDSSSAMTMVESGLGVAILNGVIAKTLRGSVVFRPLDPAQYVEIGIATHSIEEMSPVVRRFTFFVEDKLLKG